MSLLCQGPGTLRPPLALWQSFRPCSDKSTAIAATSKIWVVLTARAEEQA